MIIFLLQEDRLDPTLRMIFIIIFFVGMAIVILSRFYVFFEQRYAERYKKPFFVHRYLFRNRLSDNQKNILLLQFSFYGKLNKKQKSFFEHRVATFIKNKNFVGRKELVITDEIMVMVASTAVMLTFGFRDYLIELLENIVIYPKEFFSKANDDYHKGEFNPQLRTMVFSWKHIKEGFDDANDNVNLAIHEFAHALHLDSMKGENISATIFNDGYEELILLLSNNKSLRKNLIASRYFRDYAFTNQYEFVAVIIETFFESPSEFKQQFPRVYKKTKQMLNFNFANY